MVRNLAASLTLAVALLAVPRSGHAQSCGDTLTASTTLTSDVVDCGLYGLVIGADDVVLDCDGHAIGGETLHSAPVAGVLIGGRARVTVKNCRVSRFTTGIDASQTTASTFESNTITDTGTGIALSRSASSNTLRANAISGALTGIALRSSNSNAVIGNALSGNRDNGVTLSFANGNTLDGNTVTGSAAGFNLESASSNTVSGNTLTGNKLAGITTYGITANVIRDNLITGNGAGGTGAGVRLISSGSNQLLGNTITGNSGDGLLLGGATDSVIHRNTLRANTRDLSSDSSSGNDLTLNYFGGALTCADKPRFRGLILGQLAPYYLDAAMTDPATGAAPVCPPSCGDLLGGTPGDVITLTADLGSCSEGLNIVSDGVVLDCAGHSITGSASAFTGVYLDGRTGVTIRNCSLSGFSVGVYASSSSSTTLAGNTLSGNRSTGVTLSAGSSNMLSANTITGNGGSGVNLFSSSSNALTGNTISANQGSGVLLLSSSANTLADNTVGSNLGGGIAFSGGGDNVVNRNRFLANQSYELSNDVSIDNDYTQNYFGGALTCDDKARFRNLALLQLAPYYLDAAMSGSPTGTAPQGCPLACGDTVAGSPGEVIKMKQDLTDCIGSGLDIASDDLTINCDGHSLSGTPNGFAGIHLAGRSGVTIKNCVLTGFPYGLYLSAVTGVKLVNDRVSGGNTGISVQSSTGVVIKDSTVTGSRFSGIELLGSSGSTLAGNHVSGGSQIGLSVVVSNGGRLLNNVLTGNATGLRLRFSSSNDVNGNQVCGSTTTDIFSQSSSNSGNDNICDTTHGWSDTGAAGCTTPCE